MPKPPIKVPTRASSGSRSAISDPTGGEPILSVSDLNRQARVTIERQFNRVWISGELSNFARPRSGHWYFTLKDDRAQVRCAMFANRNRLAHIQPSDGQQVLLQGRVSLYEGRGEFQVIVDHIEPAGEGALRQAFDALKVKLAAEGLFDASRKQPLPDFPRHCVVITSASGAALHDVLAVWSRRYPMLRTTLIPVSVQGSEAEPQILSALARAQTLTPDVILVTRGGGSLEDLWCFNSEALARKIAQSDVPVVSAIGHEIDVTICDFVADLRAPTPSAAAELIVPDRQQLIDTMTGVASRLVHLWQSNAQHQQLQVQHLQSRLVSPQVYLEQVTQRIDFANGGLTRQLKTQLIQLTARLDTLSLRLTASGPGEHLTREQQRLTHLRERLSMRLVQQYRQRKSTLATLSRMLHSVSPLPTLERGYTVVRSADGRAITNANELVSGQPITGHLSQGSFTATVQDIDPNETLVDSFSVEKQE